MRSVTVVTEKHWHSAYNYSAQFLAHRNDWQCSQPNEEAELTRNIFIKIFLTFGLGLAVVWFASIGSSQSTTNGPTKPANHATAADYVGSDACKDCHEDQFKAFSHTSHAELAKAVSWKDKTTGCESCHGPGKAHIAEGDPTKIISFKNKSSKEVSETCLTCHAGREERNNFRRGEHWRNDIGCTDCH